MAFFDKGMAHLDCNAEQYGFCLAAALPAECRELRHSDLGIKFLTARENGNGKVKMGKTMA